MLNMNLYIQLYYNQFVLVNILVKVNIYIYISRCNINTQGCLAHRELLNAYSTFHVFTNILFYCVFILLSSISEPCNSIWNHPLSLLSTFFIICMIQTNIQLSIIY